jgi:hypothetical protein
VQIQQQQMNDKLNRQQEHEQIFRPKAAHRLTELELKNHEDNLKHFQKVVQKDQEFEKDLYKTVKEAEFHARKKDNELKKLQDEYIEMKKKNSARIKELIAAALAQEKECEQKILKEKSLLKRVNLDFFLT